MFQQVTGEREEDREQERVGRGGGGGVDKERSDKEGEKNAIWCRNGKRMESVAPRGQRHF